MEKCRPGYLRITLQTLFHPSTEQTGAVIALGVAPAAGEGSLRAAGVVLAEAASSGGERDSAPPRLGAVPARSCLLRVRTVLRG